MDRWGGILRVSLHPNGGAPQFRVAASLCLSSTSKTLTSPSANAIFFNGDQVKGTGNPVIDKLSDTQNIAEILVSKLGLSVNAWVVEASTYSGPFAVYKEFVPSVNLRGEPKCYNPDGFPASTTTMLLIAKCLEEAKNVIPGGQELSTPRINSSTSCPHLPKTIILGFSKGGTVLNQLLTEFAHLIPEAAEGHAAIKNLPMQHFPEIYEQYNIFPVSHDSFFNSISEFHYVDVGLNTAGAYLTDQAIVKKISGACHGALRVSILHFMGLPGSGVTAVGPGSRMRKIDCCGCLKMKLARVEAKCRSLRDYTLPTDFPIYRCILK